MACPCAHNIRIIYEYILYFFFMSVGAGEYRQRIEIRYGGATTGFVDDKIIKNNL